MISSPLAGHHHHASQREEDDAVDTRPASRADTSRRTHTRPGSRREPTTRKSSLKKNVNWSTMSMPKKAVAGSVSGPNQLERQRGDQHGGNDQPDERHEPGRAVVGEPIRSTPSTSMPSSATLSCRREQPDLRSRQCEMCIQTRSWPCSLWRDHLLHARRPCDADSVRADS